MNHWEFVPIAVHRGPNGDCEWPDAQRAPMEIVYREVSFRLCLEVHCTLSAQTSEGKE